MIPTAQELNKFTYSQIDLRNSKLKSIAEEFINSKFLNTKLVDAAADRRFSCEIDLKHCGDDKAPDAIGFIMRLLEEKGYNVRRFNGQFVLHIDWCIEREVK